MDCSLPGSAVHGIFQATILEWVAISFSRVINNKEHCITNFTLILQLWSGCCCCSVSKSCLTLSNPMDCSPPDHSVHGILQARILEWVVIPFSSGSSQPRHQTWVSCIAGGFFTVWVTGEPPGKPLMKCQGLVKYGDWVSSGCNKNLNTYFIKRKKKLNTYFIQKIHERRHSLN